MKIETVNTASGAQGAQNATGTNAPALTLEEMLDFWTELEEKIESVAPLLKTRRALEFAIRQVMEAKDMREVPHPRVLATLMPTTIKGARVPSVLRFRISRKEP